MKLFQRSGILISVLMIVLGILCVTMKSAVLSSALNILGFGLIVIGIMTLVSGRTGTGIGQIIAGALIVLLGWTVVSLALYIVALLMLVYGISGVVRILRFQPSNPFPALLSPALTAVIGFMLFFNKTGALNGVFTAVGILLILNGALGLLSFGSNR